MTQYIQGGRAVSFSIKGTVANAAALPSATAGDVYITANDKHFHVCTTGSTYVDLGDLHGVSGASGNTILNGAADPIAQGQNGDFYVNTTTYKIFGPKATGVWPAGTQLVSDLKLGDLTALETDVKTTLVDAVNSVIDTTLATAIDNIVDEVPADAPLGPTDSSSPGLQLWLKADAEIYTDTDPVAIWHDQSGNDRDVKQATTANKPLFLATQINALQAVFFNKAHPDYFRVSSDVATPDDVTIVAVIKRGEVGVAHMILFAGNAHHASTNYELWVDTDNKLTFSQAAGDYKSTGTLNTSAHVVTARRSGLSIHVNIDSGTEDVAAATTNSEDAGIVMLGAAGASKTQPMQGVIAELLVWDRYLSDADVAAIEGYLKTKYAIA